MASDTTKTMEVQALWDGTKLKAGTEEAEASVEALADSVEAASDSMRASLDSIDDGVSSTLGPGGSFSTSVDNVEDEGGRMTEVGSEVGAEFAANLAEGVNSGDMVGSVTDTFSGLSAAAAATGNIGLIAAGVGAVFGATIIRGITNAVTAREQAVVDAMNGIMEGVVSSAATGMKAVREAMLAEFDITEQLKRLSESGDDAAEGWAVVEDLSKATGEHTNVILDALAGKINPATDRFREKLLAVEDEGTKIGSGFYEMSQFMSETAKQADRTTVVLGDTERALEGAERGAEGLAGWMERNKVLSEGTKEANERSADALERAEAAITRINSRNPGGWALQ